MEKHLSFISSEEEEEKNKNNYRRKKKSIKQKTKTLKLFGEKEPHCLVFCVMNKSC